MFRPLVGSRVAPLRAEVRDMNIDVSVVMPVVVNTELGSGLPETRGFKAMQPEDVADSIVEALQTGRFEVFVRAFPAGRSLQVSVDGGDEPYWSADGSEIYFTAFDGNYIATSFHAAGTTAQPGKPVVLFHPAATMVSFVPSHKPGRFLGVVRTAPAESIGVINYMSGWMAKLQE